MASLGDGDSASAGLPAETPQFKYQGLLTCLEIIESQFSRAPSSPDFISDRLIFYNILPHESQSLEARLKYSSAKFSSYDPSQYILTVKMASRMHASATEKFAEFVVLWKASMGMDDDIDNSPGKIYGGSKSKVPDGAWIPSWDGAEVNRQWPSMLLEVGYKETRAKIERDMNFWLRESKRQVRIALSISVQPRSPGRVVLEQWALTPADRKTRSGQEIEIPEVVQSMTATRRPGLAPVISPGNFVLPFDAIFLKSATSEPTARDFVVSNLDMERLANVVWERQFGTL